MIESFKDEQEESAAASKIENVLRRDKMQFQILDALTIDPKPMIDIGVLVAAVAFCDLPQLILIDSGENWAERQPENGALRTPPTAPISFATRKLGQLSVQFHLIASAISRNRPGPR
jgi:hypothetical protein